jgi:hypothetical protein
MKIHLHRGSAINKKDKSTIREIDTFSGLTANSQAYVTQKGANVDGFTPPN